MVKRWRLWATRIAQYTTAALDTFTVGIRREGKSRWECRAPLTPSNVGSIKTEMPHARFIVQPCTKRVFGNAEYERAGAELDDNLAKCDLILGVKEVPIQELMSNKTYMFFSHTHKGQPHNMPLLQAIVERGIRLIDYELLARSDGQRLVAFGRHAGIAGFINALHGLGDKLLHLGYRTPFLHVGLAHQYVDVADARATLRRIRATELPVISPLVFVFTGGHGRVSKGAQEMFAELPDHCWIRPDELPAVVSSASSRGKVYGCVVEPADYIEHTSGAPFSMDEFKAKPESFRSTFHETIAPYASVIVNGVYWEPGQPRLLTKEQISRLGDRSRLLAIADISCDIGGSIEFTDRATTIDSPFFYYDPSNTTSDRQSTRGIQIMSIDNLPTQLPKDASEHFGRALTPLVGMLVSGLSDGILEQATICRDGRLAGKCNSLLGAVAEHKPKRVLVLGSGHVVPPAIDYLTSLPGVQVTIASNLLEDARKIAGRYGHGKADAVQVIANDSADLSEIVKQSDIAISFLPASMHVSVAKACIQNGKHLITASYVSPQMQALHSQAVARNVLLLNELGLDPGIDHLEAMRLIDEAHAEGLHVTSFQSWCGGLPAPQHADNPLGYKFSWSPRGVLLAALNEARYLKDGHEISIPAEKLLESVQPVQIAEYPAFAFEGIPNRDSLAYRQLYGIETAQTMLRGTLRYAGFCSLMSAFRQAGLLDTSSKCRSWVAAKCSFVG